MIRDNARAHLLIRCEQDFRGYTIFFVKENHSGNFLLNIDRVLIMQLKVPPKVDKTNPTR